MRLIDADALKQTICLDQCDYMKETCDAACELIAYITNAPTIEAEPVVRCKDCKFYPDGEGTTKWEPCCDMITPPNWYCADGVAKRDGEE